MTSKMENNIQSVNYKELSLDTQNPRLPESIRRDPKSMIDYIAETTAIEDLMSAIAENGFFVGEPLVVVEDVPGEKIVVEGNRRLTAVTLLNEPAACSTPTTRMLQIVQSAKSSGKEIPNELPIVVRTRKDSLPYLGFRHITGIQQWEPLAKARYLKNLYDMTPETLIEREKFLKVAQTIGSRVDYIRRSLYALAVYRIIELHSFFDIEGLNDRSIKFAILSTALADERIRNFIEISNTETEVSDNDNFDENKFDIGNIKQLTRWLFERDDNGKTRLGESRNLRKLSAIVSNSAALKSFIAGAHLDTSYELTSDNKADFMKLLYDSLALLSQASSMVATVEFDESALRVSQDIRDQIRHIGNTLTTKKSEKDDDGF